MLPLRLLREGLVQAAQQAKLRLHHMVDFHTIRAVSRKVHVAVQFADGLIIQSQRFLQSLLAVAVGVYNTLIVIHLLQKLVRPLQRFRLLGLQHGCVG